MVSGRKPLRDLAGFGQVGRESLDHLYPPGTRVTLGSTGAGSRGLCVPWGLRVTHRAEASLTQERGWGLMSAKSSHAEIECPMLCDLRQVS